METPLAKVRGLGASGTGTGNFIIERVTAVFLLVLAVPVIAIIVTSAGRPYDQVVELVGNLWVAVILLAFVLLSALHMHAGMRVIIEDYVHGTGTRLALLLANAAFAFAIAAASLIAVVKLAAG